MKTKTVILAVGVAMLVLVPVASARPGQAPDAEDCLTHRSVAMDTEAVDCLVAVIGSELIAPTDLPTITIDPTFSATCNGLIEVNTETSKEEFYLVDIWFIEVWKDTKVEVKQSVRWEYDCSAEADVTATGAGGAYREVALVSTSRASGQETAHGSCQYSGLPRYEGCTTGVQTRHDHIPGSSGEGKQVPDKATVCIRGDAKAVNRFQKPLDTITALDDEATARFDVFPQDVRCKVTTIAWKAMDNTIDRDALATLTSLQVI